ncbi:MAG: CRISPR-associated endonuclease Cas2 [Campylobacter sp.]|nr:CRISPR-associated endonuclease Cas2 [Campylobacter sp.]
MKFLVCYDIENSKNRTKLFERLKDFGLFAVQKSVFYGELSHADKVAIKGLIARYCSQGDKAIITTVKLDIKDTFGYDEKAFEIAEFAVL